MSIKSELAKLRAAYEGNNRNENSNNTFTKFYPFYKMQTGEKCVVRFIPDLDESNSLGCLIENKYHMLTVNGKTRRVPSLTMWGKECPISKVARDFYEAGDKENGKKYYRKVNYIGQVLVVEDPLPPQEDGTSYQGTVQPISFNFQIYNVIKEAYASDDLETIPYGIGGEGDSPDTWGYDFTIRRTEQGGYANYVVGTKFANRPRPLTEQELNVVNENRVKLSSYLPQEPTIEKVTAMLQADLNGDTYEDSTDEGPSVSAPSKPTLPQTPQGKAAIIEEDDQESSAPEVATTSSVNDVIAQIRARKAKQQQQ